MSFGPEYTKINTLWMRAGRKNIVVPGVFAQPEFEYLARNPWRWTEKIDGHQMRLHFDGKSVTINGKTDDAQISSKLFVNMMPLINDTDRWTRQFGTDADVTVYGEGYGAGIRSGGVYRPDQAIILYDVYIRGKDGDYWWLQRANIENVAEGLGLDVVPLIGTFTLSEAWEMLCQDGLRSAWEGAPIEGLVGKPAVELKDRKGDRLITKMKVEDWKAYQRDQAERAKSGD